jgi:hypothetical protein
LSNRIARNIFATVLVGSALFASGGASAAQLTLNWVDQAGGTAYFTIERKTETTGAYAPIATTGTGTTTYADPTVVASTTYCYRVKASNVFGDSGYSNEACGSVAAGLDVTVTKAGTGSGTVVSNPSGINCGGDCVASFAPGRVITLTAIPSSGSTFSGWSGAGCSGRAPCTLVGNVPLTVTATFTGSSTEATPPTLTLVYNGMLRDRVGQSNTALGPDAALDGTLTATLSAAGGRTITGLRLDSNAPGTWDTTSATDYWVLGVAATLDGPLLNAAGTMAVNFAVADGGSLVLFASDYLGTEFLSGNTLTLTVTFADGLTATAVTTVPSCPESERRFMKASFSGYTSPHLDASRDVSLRVVKKTYRRQPSSTIAISSTLYAHGLSINFRSSSTRERPKPTTHASKLMQMRRKASASSRRMK